MLFKKKRKISDMEIVELLEETGFYTCFEEVCECHYITYFGDAASVSIRHRWNFIEVYVCSDIRDEIINVSDPCDLNEAIQTAFRYARADIKAQEAEQYVLRNKNRALHKYGLTNTAKHQEVMDRLK